MPEKSLISVIIASTLILILLLSVVIFCMLLFRKNKNLYYIEKQLMMQTIIEEGERMSNQIGKEVHDNIGQLSNLLRKILYSLESLLTTNEQRELSEKIAELAEMIIKNADHIGHSLNSDFIKVKGFSNVIQGDIERIKATGKINCAINLMGIVKPINPDMELVVYRIAQEAMRNVLNHANASLMEITLVYTDEGFSMKIKDNGSGFDLEKAEKKGRTGLVNMQHRAKSLNAILCIDSKPGQGCSITLSFSYAAVPEIIEK